MGMAVDETTTATLARKNARNGMRWKMGRGSLSASAVRISKKMPVKNACPLLT
jgi:hypothetical protein